MASIEYHIMGPPQTRVDQERTKDGQGTLITFSFASKISIPDQVLREGGIEMLMQRLQNIRLDYEETLASWQRETE